MQISKIEQDDHDWIVHLITDRWASTKIVTRGRIYEVSELAGYIARDKGQRVGLATYHIENEECELVTLDSLVEGIGVGSNLLAMVENTAKSNHCSRVFAITTNDNTAALRFYQKRGYSIAEIYVDTIKQSRKLKPELPHYGNDGIPIRDEIELAKKIEYPT